MCYLREGSTIRSNIIKEEAQLCLAKLAYTKRTKRLSGLWLFNLAEIILLAQRNVELCRLVTLSYNVLVHFRCL